MADDSNDIFISYSHADKDFAHRLADDLIKKGVKVWLDELNIEPGANVVRAINEGIQHSSHMLVFLSKQSIKSNWVQEEWSSKYGEEVRKNSIMVIPTIIDDLSPDLIPPVLAGKKYVNFLADYEGEIGKITDLLIRKRKEYVERKTVDEMKDVFLKSRKGTSDQQLGGAGEIVSLLKKLSKAKEKGWDSKRIISVLLRDVDYAHGQAVKAAKEAERRNEEDPKEFNVLMMMLSSMTLKPLEDLRGKLVFIANQQGNPDDVLEELEFELESILDARSSKPG